MAEVEPAPTDEILEEVANAMQCQDPNCRGLIAFHRPPEGRGSSEWRGWYHLDPRLEHFPPVGWRL